LNLIILTALHGMQAV